MRYVESRLEDFQREEAYRIYVTTSLQLAPQQKWLGKSYADLLVPDNKEEKTGDDIVTDVFNRAGLKFK